MLTSQRKNTQRGLLFFNNPSSTFLSGHYSTKLPVFGVGLPAPQTGSTGNEGKKGGEKEKKPKLRKEMLLQSLNCHLPPLSKHS